jgi:hypothetical protein
MSQLIFNGDRDLAQPDDFLASIGRNKANSEKINKGLEKKKLLKIRKPSRDGLL